MRADLSAALKERKAAGALSRCAFPLAAVPFKTSLQVQCGTGWGVRCSCVQTCVSSCHGKEAVSALSSAVCCHAQACLNSGLDWTVMLVYCSRERRPAVKRLYIGYFACLLACRFSLYLNHWTSWLDCSVCGDHFLSAPRARTPLVSQSPSYKKVKFMLSVSYFNAFHCLCRRTPVDNLESSQRLCLCVCSVEQRRDVVHHAVLPVPGAHGACI